VVGVAANAIGTACPEAVMAVGNTQSDVVKSGHGYSVQWSKNGHRVIIHRTGRWTWDKRVNGKAVTQRRGSVLPLHDDRWVRAMTLAGHDPHTARVAIGHFKAVNNGANGHAHTKP
jgi:hypothetical protein